MATPVIVKKGPYVIKETAGKKSWCSCGLSANQPYCDHSHRGKTELRSVKVELTKPQKVAWCGCKHTKNPPYCDGSHTKLKIVSVAKRSFLGGNVSRAYRGIIDKFCRFFR